MSMTRGEYLQWCKDRALAEIDGGNRAGAVASMMQDLSNWEGPPLINPDIMQTLMVDGMMFRNTDDQMRDWVNGFN